jgi:hypothetical protein
MCKSRGRDIENPWLVRSYAMPCPYIKDELGVVWRKSACRFCPFARISPELIARQKQFPLDTASAMFTERLSLSMNERGQLYNSGSLYQIAAAAVTTRQMSHFNLLLDRQK